jgi:hypothetical protein
MLTLEDVSVTRSSVLGDRPNMVAGTRLTLREWVMSSGARSSPMRKSLTPLG